MTLIPKTCFFTGHRVIPKEKHKAIESWLRQEILDKINNKTTVFIAGGALGFDTMAAEQVIALREDYDFIRLCLYIPCINHDENWEEPDRERFEKIKALADEVYYVSKSPWKPNCMKKRNQAMVEASDECIAYLVNQRSGSAQTVNMAEKKGIDVINIAKKMLIN